MTLPISTFEFLKKLKQNNSKEWFDANRIDYTLAKEKHIHFVNELILSITKFDTKIKGLEAKTCLFRINRDVRFSNNKSPYKTNIGASISPGGKKSGIAGYYLHIEPGASFIAGGMWQPESNLLAAIRQEIDYNSEEIAKILNNNAFKLSFGGLSNEDKLKTVPKGYDKLHPQIELLKHKSFIVFNNFTDKEVLAEGFLKQCIKYCKDMYPLLTFLRKACD